jgi:hypothetical protein
MYKLLINISKLLLTSLLMLISIGCQLGPLNSSDYLSKSIYMTDKELLIEKVPLSLGKNYTSKFDRYTKITTPSGNVIHIVAQNQISNEKIVRARSVLLHYITNLDGSLYGHDKSSISNKMAENGAILLLLNGSDDGSNQIELNGQPLYDDEIQVEGDSWYINQNYEHRDATFEEILHLVHDYGIGVDGINTLPGALPEFQKIIRKAQENAIGEKIWGIGAADWISELKKENSLSQEYLAALIDVYYGLWGAWKDGSKGMYGLFAAKIREDISIRDPIGFSILKDTFFHSFLTYQARIDADFKGTFSLRFNENLPYTHHSRYLKDILLNGKNNNNIRINELNNSITGNIGVNTVIFTGRRDDYTISSTLEEIIVTDNIKNRDGINSLKHIEKLKFIDLVINL